MPIHLNSVSRRTFLGSAAALSLSPAAGLQGQEFASPHGWAILSDTHVAADPAKKSRQGVNMANHLERVVKDVLKERVNLSGVIINGDCAFNDGQPGDYETLIKILKPLTDSGLPIHCTLGNHDDRDIFYQAAIGKEGQSPVESKHCSIVETPHANWVLIDTLRFVNKVEGELGQPQLDWLSDYLTNQTEKPAIIVGHHYPQVFRTDVIPSEEKIKISGLIDSEPFLKLLATHPQAKAYIYGHSHDWKLSQDEHQLHHINLPPTAYVFNPDRPAGWIKATIQKDGIALEMRSIDTDHAQHGETHDLTWR